MSTWYLLLPGLMLHPVVKPQEADSANPVKLEYKVPYRITDVKHIMVRLKINGKGPFNFILDTGAPADFVGTAVAKQLEIKSDDSGWAKLAKLEIEGGVTFEGKKVRIEDPFQLVGMNKTNLGGIRYDGILGYTTLAQYKIEYDFSRPHLVWTKLNWKPLPPPMMGKMSDAGGEMGAMVSLSSLATSFFPRKVDPELVYKGLFGFEYEQAGDKVRVTSVYTESAADVSSIKAGDLIVQVKEMPIKKVEEFRKVLNEARWEKELIMIIQRGNSEKEITIKPGRGF